VLVSTRSREMTMTVFINTFFPLSALSPPGGKITLTSIPFGRLTALSLSKGSPLKGEED
jgi:hypothetical protein